MNASLMLFWTIWIALILFVIGEVGNRRTRWVSACGLVLLVVHIVIAFGSRHGWSHDAAMRDTARQTAAVYGLDWGGGIYANYLFVAAWMRLLWRTGPVLTWVLRALILVVILNAAVIFAPMPRRALGIAIVLALVCVWFERLPES